MRAKKVKRKTKLSSHDTGSDWSDLHPFDLDALMAEITHIEPLELAEIGELVWPESLEFDTSKWERELDFDTSKLELELELDTSKWDLELGSLALSDISELDVSEWELIDTVPWDDLKEELQGF